MPGLLQLHSCRRRQGMLFDDVAIDRFGRHGRIITVGALQHYIKTTSRVIHQGSMVLSLMGTHFTPIINLGTFSTIRFYYQDVSYLGHWVRFNPKAHGSGAVQDTDTCFEGSCSCFTSVSEASAAVAAEHRRLNGGKSNSSKSVSSGGSPKSSSNRSMTHVFVPLQAKCIWVHQS